MKLAYYNYLSAACFFLSSASILAIPLLDFSAGFPLAAYLMASQFWCLLIAGIGLQIYLHRKTKNAQAKSKMKLYKFLLAGIFAISVILFGCALIYFKTSPIALPIDLFVVLFSAECFAVIHRMEKIL